MEMSASPSSPVLELAEEHPPSVPSSPSPSPEQQSPEAAANAEAEADAEPDDELAAAYLHASQSPGESDTEGVRVPRLVTLNLAPSDQSESEPAVPTLGEKQTTDSTEPDTPPESPRLPRKSLAVRSVNKAAFYRMTNLANQELKRARQSVQVTMLEPRATAHSLRDEAHAWKDCGTLIQFLRNEHFADHVGRLCTAV
jgi:hypothetical protein